MALNLPSSMSNTKYTMFEGFYVQDGKACLSANFLSLQKLHLLCIVFATPLSWKVLLDIKNNLNMF